MPESSAPPRIRSSFALLSTLILGVACPASRGLEVGVARVDLTPPLEMKASLGGYGERMSRPATGVHDRVWAKGLVIRDGAGGRHAIVTADVLAFPPGIRESVAEQLASEGWRADDLLLLASHSHTSLDMTALNPKNTFNIPQLGIFMQALHDRTVARLAEVVRKAAAAPREVRVGAATRTLQGWNRNRRHGPEVDPDMTVVRVDTPRGEPVAVWVNWTAHPTFMGPQHMEFSGDWPGHLQRTLEALIGSGVEVLYCNGAEGDQSPTPRVAAAPAWEQAERYGRELGLQAWEAWKSASTQPDATLAWKTTIIPLPARVAHADFKRTGGKEYGLDDGNIGKLLDRLCPAETHSTAIRIGDLVVAGIPGEMAAGLGLEIKQALRTRPGVSHVILGGLADEWISYMLTPAEYRKGGYEASVSFYGETLGPTLVRAITDNARQLP
jgi:hypothetical protein